MEYLHFEDVSLMEGASELVTEVNLPLLVNGLLKKWKFVAMLVGAVGLIVAVLNFYILPSWYESSVTLLYPNGDRTTGMDFQVFQTVVSEFPLMVGGAMDEGVIPADSLGEHRVSVDERSSTITIAVTATSPEGAVAFLERWIEVVRTRLLGLLEERLRHRMEAATSVYFELKEQVKLAENRLADFDREHPVALMEAQLAEENWRIIAAQSLLDNLKSVTIPSIEATANHLVQTLALEPRVIETSSEVIVLNPVYLELRMELTRVESMLAAQRRRAEHLEKDLVERQALLAQKSHDLNRAKIERERLVRELEEVKVRFEAARTELDEVLRFERQLPNLARVEVISGPHLPTTPIAPQRYRNVTIAVVGGFLVSLVGIALLDWWRGVFKGSTVVSITDK